MADPAGLLAKTEESLQNVASELERLDRRVEQKEKNYYNAAEGERREVKVFWEAAVRDREAVRRDLEAVRAAWKALIEFVTKGQRAFESLKEQTS